MSSHNNIQKITIKGFQSIQSVAEFELNDLNVLIGANGAGKSNFVAYFRMLSELVAQRLQVWVSKQGGADRVLTYGVKVTSQLHSEIFFDHYRYRFTLEPTALGGLTFVEEAFYDETSDTLTLEEQDELFIDDGQTITLTGDSVMFALGSGHLESKLAQQTTYTVGRQVLETISHWKVFHFHDTSDTAGVKQLKSLHDYDYLRSDASNLAAYLYQLRQKNQTVYQEIRKIVQLAIPFFDDFVLKPIKLPNGEEQIQLRWHQRDSDYPFLPSQFSDGSLRFICLTTALLQPVAPSTMIIDEPELGLHPYAITLLGALIRSASKRMQLIISTQSVTLLNEFSLDNVIVVDREAGVTTLKRLNADAFQDWLDDYSVGELWEKNILGGRPI